MVAQALCLSIFTLSPTQKTCLFTDGNKANVSVLALDALGLSFSDHSAVQILFVDHPVTK